MSWLKALVPASHSEGPGLIPGQSMWELWWTNYTGRGFSPSTSALPCQYHSTNAPYSSPTTRCPYQKNKRAKPENLAKSNTISGGEKKEHWVEKCCDFQIHTVKTDTIRNSKVKVKFTLEQATKAQRGSRGIALLFPWPACRQHRRCFVQQAANTV